MSFFDLMKQTTKTNNRTIDKVKADIQQKAKAGIDMFEYTDNEYFQGNLDSKPTIWNGNWNMLQKACEELALEGFQIIETCGIGTNNSRLFYMEVEIKSMVICWREGLTLNAICSTGTIKKY